MIRGRGAKRLCLLLLAAVSVAAVFAVEESEHPRLLRRDHDDRTSTAGGTDRIALAMAQQDTEDEFTTSSFLWESLMHDSSLPSPTKKPTSPMTRRPTTKRPSTPRPTSDNSAVPTDLFPTASPSGDSATTPRPTRRGGSGPSTFIPTTQPTPSGDSATSPPSAVPTDVFSTTTAPVGRMTMMPRPAPITESPIMSLYPTKGPVLVAPASPVAVPTGTPIVIPVATPNAVPTGTPIAIPVASPVTVPTGTPIAIPAASPVAVPTGVPIAIPTGATPIAVPTGTPIAIPVASPVTVPTGTPIAIPAASPVAVPTGVPIAIPTGATPIAVPTGVPIAIPVASPVASPVAVPTGNPIATPTSAAFAAAPTGTPIATPVAVPTGVPIAIPTSAAPVAAAPSDETLLGLIESDVTLTEFRTFVDASGRIAVISNSNPQTLFAPNNAAFEVLEDEYKALLLDNDDYFLHLRSLVDNHITLEGSYQTFDDNQVLTMLSQEESRIESRNDFSFAIATFASTFDFVDAVNLPSSGEVASNGVLYNVQSLLLPVWYYLDLITLMEVQSNTYSTVLSLLDTAGLTEAVATSQSTTLIAPNNDAFAALPAEVMEYLTTNVEALKDVLLYHFLPEIVNPLLYPLGQTVQVASSEGSNVDVLIQRSADNTAATSFNGVSTIGNIFLSRYSIRFEVAEVLLPPGFEIPDPPTAATLPPTLTPVTLAPVQAPVPFTRPSSIPRPEPTLRPTPVTPTAMPTIPSGTGLSIVDEISSDSDVAVFLTVLNSAKVYNRVASDSEQTIFAPVNTAFNDVDSEYLQTLFTDQQYFLHMQSFADNHVTRQGALETLEDGTVLELSSGEQCTVNVRNSGAVSIETVAASSGLVKNVPVRSTPFVASNGALYVTENVLAPIWYYQNIMDVLQSGGRFKTLLTLIDLARLNETIADSTSTTLLAPNNDAFAALPEETLNFLTDEANVEILRSVLLYHFLPLIANPLMYPMNTDVNLTSTEGRNVTLRIERETTTSYNGVSQIGSIHLAKYGARIQLGEVLLPPGLALPGL